MSRSPLAGEEWSAVQRALRTTSVVLGATALVTTGILALTPADPFPLWQLRIDLAILLLLIPMAIWRKSDVSAYLAVAGLYLLGVSTGFSVPLSDARLSASTVLFLASLGGILYLRGWWQAAWIGLIAITWSLVVPQVPLPADVLGRTVNLRWSSLLQILLASAWVASAWNREREQLLARDDVARRVEASVTEAAVARERIRVWRASLTRIHETVLNDIRSVLDADTLDGNRLRRQLQATDSAAPPQWGPTSLHQLVSTIGVSQEPGKRIIIGPLARVHLETERAAGLRNILIELLRNEFRHGRSSEVRVSATLDGDHLQVLLAHDATEPDSERQPPGVGIGILQESASAIGAVVEREPQCTRVLLPLHISAEAVPSAQKLDVGRAVISSGTAGFAVGGTGSALALGLSGRPVAMLCAALTLLLLASAAWSTWQRRLPTSLLIVCTVAATAVPLLMRALIDNCSDVALPVTVTTLASMAFATVVAWAPTVRWWWLAVGHAAGMLALTPLALAACPRSVVPPLLASLIAPSLLAVNFVALRRSAQREGRLVALRRREATEQAAADAARELGDQLHATIARVRSLLFAVADRGQASAETRRELRCLDADLRSALQVEPASSGAFARLARAAIHEAAQAKVPVLVRAIRDSGDPRALPEEVTAAVRGALLGSTDGEATVMVLPSGDADTLVITTSPAALFRAGLGDGWQCSYEDGSASVTGGADSEPAVLIVRRTPRTASSAEHRIRERTKTVDGDGDVLAISQGTDPGWRPGEDHVTG